MRDGKENIKVKTFVRQHHARNNFYAPLPWIRKKWMKLVAGGRTLPNTNTSPAGHSAVKRRRHFVWCVLCIYKAHIP